MGPARPEVRTRAGDFDLQPDDFGFAIIRLTPDTDRAQVHLHFTQLQLQHHPMPSLSPHFCFSTSGVVFVLQRRAFLPLSALAAMHTHCDGVSNARESTRTGV